MENKKEASANRIEEAMSRLKEKKEKAFITYMTAGLPDMAGSAAIIKAQEKAGVDVIELGIPFSDPAADGPVIQASSYESIRKGTNIIKVFAMVEDLRDDSVEIPIVFMLYYNTVYHYGLGDFVERCRKVGVDGLIIPDLPMEEQVELKGYLEQGESPVLIQLVSPVSGKRIPEILKEAKGFVYCVSSMGVTGQEGGFYGTILDYLKDVKSHTDLPVMMGFGIRTPEDVEPMKEIIDGAIVGSHFIRLLEEAGYDPGTAGEYCREFKTALNGGIG